MTAPRTNKIFLIVGDRGTGKTDFCKELLAVSPQPKKLIADIFDNPVWHTMKTHKHPEWSATEIKLMPFDMLPHHRNGMYRTYVEDEYLLQEAIEKYCVNTILIVEDASRYFGNVLTRNQKKYLLNSKQKNLEIHLVFHYLSDVPKQLLKIANYLTLFKTGEPYYDKKKYFYPNFDHVFKYVSESKNQFENVTIRLK